MNKLHNIFCLLAYTGFYLSCGTNHGTLNVKTYPVFGNVFVDGKSCGEAPISVSIKTGEHVISFSNYSEQYSTPHNLEINIDDGKINEISGIYINRFIPQELPVGFSPADSIRIYGTSERKLKDGTIFDYINGGGLVYLQHGLRETTHQIFQDNERIRITVDIFDMGSPKNARDAFNNEEICPQNFITCDIGAECKAYNYEPDFLLYFIKSKYLIYMSINNDFIKNTLEIYANEINKNIPEEE